MANLTDKVLQYLLTKIKQKIPTKMSELQNDINLIDSSTLENRLSETSSSISTSYTTAISNSNKANQQKLSYSQNFTISPTNSWFFENKQIDLRDNSQGIALFELHPQVLYLLPDTDTIGDYLDSQVYNRYVSKHAYIKLLEPTGDGAAEYSFIITINDISTGGITFVDSGDIIINENAITTAGTIYIHIVNNHAIIEYI